MHKFFKKFVIEKNITNPKINKELYTMLRTRIYTKLTRSTMKLTIEFMGSLRRPQGLKRQDTVEIPDDCTLKQLLRFLEYNDHEINVLMAYRTDGSKIIQKDVLKDGDSIFLTIPIGGG